MINMLDIVDEATAAANAHGWHRRNDGERNITSHDLEDHSSHVTVVTTDKNMILIKPTARHDNEGGDDTDKETS